MRAKNKQQIYSIKDGESTTLSEDGKLELFADRVVITADNGEITIPLNDINSVKTSSKMNILLVTEEGYFEIKSSYPRSATKYIVAIRYLQGKENK